MSVGHREQKGKREKRVDEEDKNGRLNERCSFRDIARGTLKTRTNYGKQAFIFESAIILNKMGKQMLKLIEFDC